MDLVDTNYCFIGVDAGAAGESSNSGVFLRIIT
jgi:hypothetical protein